VGVKRSVPEERVIPGSPIQPGLTATGSVRWVPVVAALALLLVIAAVVILLLT
jgi:hypothetical protein